MLENITAANGKLDKSNIRCLPCGKFQSGGFDANYGILLCQNRLIDRNHMEDTLAHELVHAYDHLRFDVDWNDLRHHACSEVSARDGWGMGVGLTDGGWTDSCVFAQWGVSVD